MSDTITDIRFADAIQVAIEEAGECGISDEEIVEMLRNMVDDLREALSGRSSGAHRAA
jgi:hypothetical protein